MYVPKPTTAIETENEGNSKEKKAFKKLKYVPVDKLCQFIKGNLDANKEKKILDTLGFFISLVAVCILMLVLVQVDIYFLVVFGLLFIYTVFQMVEFLENLISYSKKQRVIKYSIRTIHV